MIAVVGHLMPPMARLLSALAARGHRVAPHSLAEQEGAFGERVIMIGAGSPLEAIAPSLLAPVASQRPARVLVLSLLGVHRDAELEELRRLWLLEERARDLGVPVLTLRLGPLVGPHSPLWLRLRSRPRLHRGGRRLLQPVYEADVIETLDRALSGAARWEGWFELVGAEIMTLGELASLARESGPRLPDGVGDWEPPIEFLECQRLGETDPWRNHFQIEPGVVSELALTWAA